MGFPRQSIWTLFKKASKSVSASRPHAWPSVCLLGRGRRLRDPRHWSSPLKDLRSFCLRLPSGGRELHQRDRTSTEGNHQRLCLVSSRCGIQGGVAYDRCLGLDPTIDLFCSYSKTHFSPSRTRTRTGFRTHLYKTKPPSLFSHWISKTSASWRSWVYSCLPQPSIRRSGRFWIKPEILRSCIPRRTWDTSAAVRSGVLFCFIRKRKASRCASTEK